MANHVDGKVIVITGAGSGFGKLIAEKAAALGGKIVGGDIDEPGVRAVVEGIRQQGGAAEHRVTDVTDKEQVDALAAAAVEAFGRIDVMVNNAGIMPLAYFADHSEAWRAWDRCIDINVKGVVYGISAVYDQMIEQGRGHVVNISSIYGNYGIPGSAVYSATKAAVRILSESLRVEAQGKIKVTVVRPTGVPGTGLGGSIVNDQAILGLTAHNYASYAQTMQSFLAGELPAEQTDPDSTRYWAINPDELAQQVLYVIDQPWGVNISDITVRATGEQYV